MANEEPREPLARAIEGLDQIRVLIRRFDQIDTVLRAAAQAEARATEATTKLAALTPAIAEAEASLASILHDRDDALAKASKSLQDFANETQATRKTVREQLAEEERHLAERRTAIEREVAGLQKAAATTKADVEAAYAAKTQELERSFWATQVAHATEIARLEARITKLRADLKSMTRGLQEVSGVVP